MNHSHAAFASVTLICVTFDPANKLLPVPSFMTNGLTAPHDNIWQQTFLGSQAKKLWSQVASLICRMQLEVRRLQGRSCTIKRTHKVGNARVGETARVKTRRAEAKAGTQMASGGRETRWD